MHSHTPVLLSVLSLVFLLSGCGVSSYVEEQRPWAEKKLKAVEGIYELARKQSPIPQSMSIGQTVTPAPSFSTHSHSRRDGWNATIVFLENLKDITVQEKTIVNMSYSHLWRAGTANLLRKGLWVDGKELQEIKDAKKCFAELKAIEYLLVLRLDGKMPYAREDGSFVGGFLKGDALLYKVATKQYVGGFPLLVKNGPTALLRKDQGIGKITYDLTLNLEKAIDQAIVKNFPGAIPVNTK